MMKMKTLAAVVLGGVLIQSAYADNFEQKLARMSPAEKAPFVNFVITMMNDEFEQKYRNDPDIEKVFVQLENQDTLVLNMKTKMDARAKRLAQSPEMRNKLQNQFEQRTDNTLCMKNQQDKSRFDALGITHTRIKLDIGDIPVSNKRSRLTWCK